MVLDASSSLTDRRIVERTTATYTRILEVLSGAMCTNDRLSVYTFATDASTEMRPLASFGAGERSRDALAELAARSLHARTRHSDLSVVLPRILRDIYRQTAIKTVFLVTDGSFFPHRRGPRRWMVDALKRRLDDLADSVESVPADTSHQIYAIGVNSRIAPAIDSALIVRWPSDSTDRLWRHGAATLDLRRARGDSLLSILFTKRFQRDEDFSLWSVLAGGTEAVWPVLSGYTTDLGGPLAEFANDSIEHLVYLPPPASAGHCAEVRARSIDDRLRTQTVKIDLGSGILCSLATPGRAEMDALSALGVRRFALLQPSRLRITGYSAGIYGLHEVVVSVNGAACDSALGARRFAHGEGWPSPDAVAAELDLTRVGTTYRSSVGLVRFDETGCLAPDSVASNWQRTPGEYVLTVHGRNGGSVQRRKIWPPRLQLLRLSYRPGGFPFPEDRLALLAICVGVRRPFAGYEQVHVNIDTVRKELTAEGAKHACRNVSVDTTTTVLRGFSGVFLLKTAGVSVARVYADAGENSRRDPPRDWIPVELKPDGWLFLPWATLVAAALVGVLAQLVFLAYAARKEKHRYSPLTLLSGSISVVISAALVVVTLELGSIIWNRYLRGATVPAPFLILLLAYGVRVFAAVLVPEELEDNLLQSPGHSGEPGAAQQSSRERRMMKAVLSLLGVFALTLALEWAAGCDGGEMTASILIFGAILAGEVMRAKARSVWSDRLWLSAVVEQGTQWLAAKFPHRIMGASASGSPQATAGATLTTGILQAGTSQAFSLPIATGTLAPPPPEAGSTDEVDPMQGGTAEAAPQPVSPTVTAEQGPAPTQEQPSPILDRYGRPVRSA
ncbi:MAG: vWA domain-containing protein [Longimicrobiaceae bacterium]